MSYFDDIDKELQELNSSLGQFRSKDKFEVPDQYFDTLEDQVMSQLIITQNQAFTELPVPENYFENLANDIAARHLERKQNTSAPSFFVRMKKPIYMAVAAAFLLVLAVRFLINPGIGSVALTQELSYEASIYYIEENLDEIELEELAALGALEEEDLTVITHEENTMEVIGDSYMEFPDLYLEQ